jgi:hypothetical protein
LRALHSETPRQPVNFFFAERRLHLPAAIGAGRAIDPGPHPPGDLETRREISSGQIALALQQRAEFPVLVLFFLRALAVLNNVET